MSFANNVTTLGVRTLKVKSSAGFGHFRNQRQSPGVQEMGRASIAFMQAAKTLRSRFVILGSRNILREITQPFFLDTRVYETGNRGWSCNPSYWEVGI
jgi:hypothetical protein